MSDFENFCKHYHGLQNPCDKGVDFETVKAGKFEYPCYRKALRNRCKLAEYPTTEEQAAHEKMLAEFFENMISARKLIIEAAHGQRNVTGTIPCPKCETGTLNWSIAFNGHVHALCTTEHCLSWME